jgi:hypothetical protein
MSNFVIGYSENDVLYNHIKSECKTASGGDLAACTTNNNVATKLKHTLDNYSALKTKLDDKNKLYNREVFFTANMIIGLGLLSIYFYGVHRVSA